jgi:thioredoxin 1
MEILEVTKENFENEVLKSPIPVLADFNADWCGPCRMMKPTLDAIAAERSDVRIVSVNIDDEEELAEEYDVASIPCLVLFKNGLEYDRSVGLRPKDAIEAFIEG